MALPFAFYGLAFSLIAVSSVVKDMNGKIWVVNVATGSYAIASSSGSFFFALNFGNQGGVPVKTWIFRACVIQGMQVCFVMLDATALSYLHLTCCSKYTPLDYGSGAPHSRG